MRRQEDQGRGYYVDRYSFRALVVVLGLIVLNILDGFFTLQLVAKGAEELNPFMAFLLQRGARPFMMVKYALTSLCLLVFLIHKNFPLLRGRLYVKHLLAGVLLLYGVLIAYEVFLLL